MSKFDVEEVDGDAGDGQQGPGGGGHCDRCDGNSTLSPFDTATAHGIQSGLSMAKNRMPPTFVENGRAEGRAFERRTHQEGHRRTHQVK